MERIIKVYEFFRGLWLYYTYDPRYIYINGKRQKFGPKPFRNLGHKYRAWRKK